MNIPQIGDLCWSHLRSKDEPLLVVGYEDRGQGIENIVLKSTTTGEKLYIIPQLVHPYR